MGLREMQHRTRAHKVYSICRSTVVAGAPFDSVAVAIAREQQVVSAASD